MSELSEYRRINGGVVALLKLIAILAVVGAFFGGAIANLTLAAEIAFVLSTIVGASILWALAACVQQLRCIEYNTRGMEVEEEGSA